MKISKILFPSLGDMVAYAGLFAGIGILTIACAGLYGAVMGETTNKSCTIVRVEGEKFNVDCDGIVRQKSKYALGESGLMAFIDSKPIECKVRVLYGQTDIFC